MTQPPYDVAILGAGPVGQVLALMLAHVAPKPARILLLQQGAPASNMAVPQSDPRVLALNQGSRVLLESLHAWPAPTANICHIHVSQSGYFGRTLIRSTDFGIAQLGSVVSYTTLQAHLAACVARTGVSVRSGPAANLSGQYATHISVSQGEATLQCRVAVQCDGMGDQERRRIYDQHAVLTSAQASLPRAGWAWERFTREGPLALLPQPHCAQTYSVVWCCSPQRAAQLARLEPAAFSQELSTAFGTRLGRLHSQGAHHVVPLALNVRRNQVQGRHVAIGNAAQTLHPVAGQGLNLGLRDAAQLAQALTPWLTATQQSPSPMLQDFARARRTDRWLTRSLTDLMPRIFASGLAPIEYACGMSLLALDLLGPLRTPLARHLLLGFRR